jgi:hypothetical protein
MRLKLLVLAILLVPLFASAAGAIYIEGQPIPDDGMMHILAAETGGPVPTLYGGGEAIQLISAPAQWQYHFGTSGAIELPKAMPGYWDTMGSMDMTGHMPMLKFPAFK